MNSGSGSQPSSPIEDMPVLPLRDVVVYPHMVVPLFVGREKSIKALEAAATGNKSVLLVAQKEASNDDPGEDDIYHVGTVSNILQLLKLPDGTVKVLVEGLKRGRLTNFSSKEPFFSANVEEIVDTSFDVREIDVLTRSLISQFEQYVKLNKKVPPEIISSITGIDEPMRLVDTMVAHMSLKILEKQQVLEMVDVKKRIEHLMGLLESEIDLLQVEKKIRGNVKRQMEKTQREYFLNEQMRAIQEELGKEGVNEVEELAKKIASSGMSKEAKDKAEAELNKLKMMSPMSAEATVSRNYIDVMLSLPWKKKSKLQSNLKNAENILDSEHFGLEKVKERILEYLAVQKRVPKQKGPIICLVGPPGVGKTSLGRSIARATQRKFVRMSLGGMRDEAEIRGHRRTYIGAMPGKILQKLAKCKVRNPFFLLDEVDKMASDFRGDPASALLEVLDPEQNTAFNDHYLEVDFDLSDVMFVATSNSLDIPAPLLDRMEIINLSGYTEEEKVSIAQKYLINKQIENAGLKDNEIKIDDSVFIDMVRYYTKEAGVRGLEREIAKLCRKVVKSILLEPEVVSHSISSPDLEKYLGVKKYRFGLAEEKEKVGHVTGLAWTQVGGEILSIEAVVVPGKGKVIRTGKLGDVMQESIQAAMTVVRSRAELFGICDNFHEDSDIHIHVPEGATPKDGPSAGIGMCTAVVSMLCGIPVANHVAMTGEITLHGKVLPIGGLKEKLLAAKRAGITDVIIPADNERDLKEIPDNIISGLTIHAVNEIEEVLKIALIRMPKPSTADEASKDKDGANPVVSKGSGNAGQEVSRH